MDDGSKGTTGYYLHTCCFTREEHEILSKIFLDKFGIEITLSKKGRLYSYMYIGAKDRDIFHKLIEPYILNSMRYKLLN
jgi:hypothetical protein